MPKDFDSLIKELVKERIEEMPHPPKGEVWGHVKARLKSERKKERKKYLLKHLKPAFVACFIIAFISVTYINFQTPVLAFANKIIKSIMVITEDTIKIYKKADYTDDKKNPDYLHGRDIDDPRIGEAQKKVNYRLFIPEYIPDDFKLNSVNVLNKYKGKETVTFLYVSSSTNNEDCFEITQRSLPDEADVAINIEKSEDTKIENLIFDGIEYTLVSNEEDLNGLLWETGNISLEINGKISRDDIVKIARSMK